MMTTQRNIAALAAGLLFAVGLVVSGMTQPAKVMGFLNVLGLQQGISWKAEAGFWDPSLAFVMGGALMVTLIAFAVQPKQGKPWFDTKFHLPAREKVDGPLIAGAALFGAGWGLAGYCPGPALVSLIPGGASALTFTLAMIVGMVLAKRMAVS
jgi:uncharacterized protein